MGNGYSIRGRSNIFGSFYGSLPIMLSFVTKVDINADIDAD